MSKEQTKDLLKFLQPYSGNNKDLALWLREFVWDLYPQSNELIYDNYNAVAFGWSVTDKVTHIFCTIAVYEKYLHFGFYFGTQISDPDKILLGKGNLYRYIIVEKKADFPKPYIKKLLKESYVNAMTKMKEKDKIIKGKTIVKSISPSKKRPGMIIPKKKKSA